MSITKLHSNTVYVWSIALCSEFNADGKVFMIVLLRLIQILEFILKKVLLGVSSNLLYLWRRPESLGLVTGVVFLTVTIIFQPFFFAHDHSVWVLQKSLCLEVLYFWIQIWFGARCTWRDEL